MAMNVVITGANRGIGLSFCKIYNDKGYNVIGVCRGSNADLEAVADRVIDNIDISNAEDCSRLSKELSETPIHILVNNAGILSRQVLGSINYDELEQQFNVNASGTLRVTEALLNNLSDDAKIAIITSRMGSVADNPSGGPYGYRMSKAAVNAAGKSLAVDLKPNGIAVGIYHPGWVTTDMTNGTGDITPDQSADRLTGLIEKLDLSNTGTFWHSNGEVLPW